MIGQIGAIVFAAGPALVQTYTEWTESVEARIGQHDVAGAYPVLEFIGPGIVSRSVPIVLNAGLGVDVQDMIDSARFYCDNGTRVTLVMGGQVVGGPGALWVVETVDVGATEFDRGGVCILAELGLGLKLAVTSAQASATASTTVTKKNTKQVLQ